MVEPLPDKLPAADLWAEVGTLEHERLDFGVSPAKDLQKTFAAMAMTDGGRVLLGIADDRSLVGCALDQRTFDTVKRAADAVEVDVQVRELRVDGHPLVEVAQPALSTHGSASGLVPDQARTAGAFGPGEAAATITSRHGGLLPDPDLGDQENIPLPVGWFDLDQGDRFTALLKAAESNLKAEILPYAEDAWIDHDKTKVGVEIPFTRHYYEYVPPRPLAVIDAELLATEARIRELLAGLVR